MDDRVRTGDLGDGDAALSRTELHPPAGGTGLRASGRSRTACLPFTKGTLFPVSYRGTAAGQGFEPRLTGSGPAVLPVRRSGTGARAPPGTRTPFRWIKSPVHHQLCLRRASRVDHRGLEPRTSCLRHRRSSGDELAAHAPGSPRGPSRAGEPGVNACGPPAALTFPTVQLTLFKPIYR